MTRSNRSIFIAITWIITRRRFNQTPVFDWSPFIPTHNCPVTIVIGKFNYIINSNFKFPVYVQSLTSAALSNSWWDAICQVTKTEFCTRTILISDTVLNCSMSSHTHICDRIDPKRMNYNQIGHIRVHSKAATTFDIIPFMNGTFVTHQFTTCSWHNHCFIQV